MFSRASFLRKHGQWLEQVDLAPLASMDRTEEVEALFEKAYAEYVPKTKKSKKSDETSAESTAEAPEHLEGRLSHALIATCRKRLLVAGVIRFLNTVLQFSFPILLNLILTYYQEVQSGIITPQDPKWKYYKGYWLSALLMMFVGSKAVTESAYFHMMNRCSWRIKTAVSSSIYRKSLRLASSEQQKTTLGEIVNLMQVDASKIEAFVLQIHVMWDGLFQIAGYMAILGNLLGWTCLVGLLIIVCAIPVMGKITGKMYGMNRSMVKYTDDRVKTVNEALQGMLCVKMYTWEESFAKQIDVYRKGELANLKKMASLRAFLRAYMNSLPPIAAAATFLVYVYAYEGTISASILFSAIVAFEMIRMPLMFYPMALAQYVQYKVSLKRVGAFLGYGEVNQNGYTRNSEKEGEIIIENATFYWMDPKTPVPRSALKGYDSSIDGSRRSSGSVTRKNSMSRFLPSRSSSALSSAKDTIEHEEEELVYPSAVMTDVNIKVPHGELCAVVGPVGSGKSTLCASILNEAVLGEGSSVVLNGNVAYVAQTAWILNKTVRDNILFGLPYNEEKYNKVIEACSLTHDLKILEDGDMTEIGERGINLSGGQKQRISVARAAYSDADVFIFDDPLSALDPEVAEKVFEKCILEMLGGKTRLLVTNQLQCLSKCDHVIALSKHGKVLEQGPYAELMNNKKGEVTRLLTGVAPSRRSVKEEKPQKEAKSNNDAPTPGKEAKKLITKEERQTGSVEFGVYLKYIKAGGGYLLFLFVFFWYLVSAGVNLMSSLWLSVWTADSSYVKNSETFYIVGYALTAVLMGIVTFIRTYGLARFGVRASHSLHGHVLMSVLRAPMR
jgi:ATP-binding cassette subfamily C (CFTR/MRP) protein 1